MVDYVELAYISKIPILDFKTSVVRVGDIANKQIQGRVVNKSYDFSIVQDISIATSVADSLLRPGAFPLADISIKVNRLANKLQIGDYFKYNNTRYGIVNMVCVVMDIDEGNLSSEVITLSVREAVEYISSAAAINQATIGSTGPIAPETPGSVLLTLSYIKIMEAPYRIAGDKITVFAIASREPSTLTLGYQVYISADDGVSYFFIGSGDSFAPHGTLVDSYSKDTYEVDDYVGFAINSSDVDINSINSITRDLLLGFTNLAILGDEIISFQKISPHQTIDNVFVIEGIVRGRFDTVTDDHVSGEHFYFLGNSTGLTFDRSEIVAGAELKFKLVPYATASGNISDATALPLTIEGRAKKPYTPLNLMVVDVLYKPTYTADIVLNWDSRIRSEGTGYGLPDVVTDLPATWEGKFEIEIWVLDVLINTYSNIDALTWTYTSSMNTTDNGALADEVLVKVVNYIIADGYKYNSDPDTILVTKE